ncbi:hypothetical protein, partial [Thermofilum sp.]|uniref:hypothetical protein n=1 Tax=Thermofilum sp. TaxID=1961369 RepID=UPI0025846CF2
TKPPRPTNNNLAQKPPHKYPTKPPSIPKHFTHSYKASNIEESEKQRFLHRDTWWEERVPLEISVETFSTGKV